MDTHPRPPITLEDVRRALARPLPGYAAQTRMATRPRHTVVDGDYAGPPRQGAVLALLYEREGALHLPLTVRSDRLNHHGGQISLPGGRQEEADADLWHTALREAQEEVGLDQPVTLLGPLSSLYIPASHFEVHPYVGWVARRPAFVLDETEVTALIELPLATLLDPAAKREETWLWRERDTQVPYYAYEGHVIWGATAMILSEFETLLADAMRGA
jgi:8-oxo-dGTP pyrophosphatase MutT (NUDIX family)